MRKGIFIILLMFLFVFSVFTMAMPPESSEIESSTGNPLMSFLPFLIIILIIGGGVKLFVWTVKQFTGKK